VKIDTTGRRRKLRLRQERNTRRNYAYRKSQEMEKNPKI